ncbi:enoyl-CoA hydratase/isomerase family protein [Variovorax paradoxus]|nr:3-hydroxyacyl-CoA dehydrogenase NAD-binding domain-containing protein [Variovorax paradoxus]MBT2304855.1 enoyl-CoA hydratase/isomerase family protein [Variovorax paradoxus]
MSTHHELRGRVALITQDYPPVNGIGAAFRTHLLAALEQAIADENVVAIVVTGKPSVFSAGADVKEFNTPAATREPRLATLIAAFEDAPKPVIAAISGTCMGGGLELALGAHYRVARADAMIGLPEVKLGLLPGAGGTQRLPRAIGLERALAMIVSGAPAPAAQFRGTRLFDAITEGEAVVAALAFAEQVANKRPLPRLRDVVLDEPRAAAVLQAARSEAAAGPLPAPLQCAEAVGWCLDTPFDEALRREREAFVGLMATPASRALRHAFAAERAAARIEGLPEGTPLRDIRRVAVLGAGTMGSGIATAFLNAGFPVTLLETSPEALERGCAAIRRNYDGSLKKGKLTAHEVERRLAELAPTLSYASLADADLVIEAVFEDMAVKEQVFRRLDAVCKPGAILASNTSYLDIDRIAGFTQRPKDVLGLHFFSPAHVMRLLEVVRGAMTGDDVLATCVALARKLKKVGVVARVCDGFIGNRMLFRYTAAAFELVRVGASPQQVDAALQQFGMAMGPLRMGDLAGLDISWAVRKRRAAEAGRPAQPVMPDKLCEAGRFGQKTGAGWYRYEAGGRDPLPDPATDAMIAEFRRAQGVVPRAVGDEEVVERCIFALVNEGARILEEGVATRASDIDVVYLNGYGFPSHRGGPMLHADTVGLRHVVMMLERFAAEPGADPSWRPAPLLVRLVEQNRGFYPA